MLAVLLDGRHSRLTGVTLPLGFADVGHEGALAATRLRISDRAG